MGAKRVAATDGFARYLTALTSVSSSWVLELRNLAVFEVAFYFAYRYGMTFPPDYPAPFWFPSSVLLCALLLNPRRTWWMYLLAPLPIRFLLFVPQGMPPWFVPACFLVDSVTATLAAWLLSSDPDRPSPFESLPEFTRYVGVAVLLAPSLSAFGGASIIATARGNDFATTWQVWCLGNTLAHLSLTPALYCLIREFRALRPTTLARHGEALLLALGVTITSWVAFYSAQRGTETHPSLLYLPVPFVLWAAIRFGPMVTGATLSLVCVLAVIGTLRGSGPFAAYAGEFRILEIQLFLFVLALPFLSLSALFRDRERALDRLRQLSGQLVGVQEAERSRIGQELHDGLGQRLVALSWGLAGLARQAEGNERFASACTGLRTQATDICKDIVRLSHELRPVLLERLGLSAALQDLCDQSTRPDEVIVSFDRAAELRHVPRSTELAIYRVVQEALRNALTHSQSDRIVIRLAESRSGLELTIIDRGRGFDVGSTTASGLGLSGMAERIRNTGGKLRVDSAPGLGTTVTASVPLQPAGNDT